jgi:hypothetical protein
VLDDRLEERPGDAGGEVAYEAKLLGVLNLPANRAEGFH